MALRHMLLLTTEPATVSSVTLALQSNGKLASGDVVRDLGELGARLQADAAPAVVVDIDAQPEAMLAALEPMVRRHADTRFIVLSREISNQLLLAAMQIGARHVMLKQSVTAELSGVLARLCPPTDPSQQGSLVTVLSAGGGCGATTVAVNLAAEIQLLEEKKRPEPVLVADLDSAYGAVAAYFGMDGEYGFFDMLNRHGPLDAQLVQSTALAHSEKLHVMLSMPRARLGDTVGWDPNRIGEAVEACQAAYPWTVIDAPRVPVMMAAELVRRSTATLLMLQLTVKDIRVAKQLLGALAGQGLSTEKVKLVAGRYRKRGPLVTHMEAARALGLADPASLGTLSNDFAAVTGAVNLGKPLAAVAPRSDFRRDLQNLAKLLVETPRTAALA
ncbi:MAG TPA: hypothetical protein VLJ39_22960 [Tepidisphaeraceae bacterium]|jgi:pilus assembly protein CpaE|nr:hypothetical protein [Tepidisphaeraceae bacterium]